MEQTPETPQPQDSDVKKTEATGSLLRERLRSIVGNPPVIPPSTGKERSEQDMLAHEAKQFQDELGWLGKPFGGKKEKPGNISGLVILLCFLIMGIAYIFPPSPESELTYGEIFAGLISVITLILGYLFGSNDRD